MKRLGVIVECGRDGADHKVLEEVIPRLREGVAVEFYFLEAEPPGHRDGACRGAARPEGRRWARVVFEPLDAL